jgi:AcrR family transcriptional regulator
MAIKTTRQEIKSMQTRQTLLDSAIELFMKYGVKKVTIDDICDHCNLTKGAFYIGVIALNNPKGVITRRVSS